MTTSRRGLRLFGLLGLAVGLGMIVAAPLATDLAGLLRGYGAMLAGSAAYMLTGLSILAWRSARRRTAVPSAARELAPHS